MGSKKVIVALDSDNLSNSINLVKSLKNDVFAFKLGYQFFFNFGLSVSKNIHMLQNFFRFKITRYSKYSWRRNSLNKN